MTPSNPWILLAVFAYMVAGFAVVVGTGLAEDFNHWWADVVNDPRLTLPLWMVMFMLMVAALVLCWATWPVSAWRWYSRHREERHANLPADGR